MILERIRAVNYGGLTDVSVGGLGPGLTVVLGPNEAGKSSLRDLVRHVLYGFPRKGARDRTHLPDAGDRHGELVFADGGGQWQVVRTEGPRGLAVNALRGAERPDLVTELTSGVSQDTFQIVFCFGLDEMQRIEDPSVDVVGRLYAGAAGLGVDPVDVRDGIEARAKELFAPRAPTARINALVKDSGELEARIRALEDAAASVAEDRKRAAELQERADAAKRAREGLDARWRTLAEDAARLRALADDARAREGGIAGKRADAEALEKRMAEKVPDAAVLASAPELRAVLDDMSGARRAMEAAASQEAGCEVLRSRIGALGVLPAEIRATREAVAGVEGWADRLRKSELRAEQAEAASAAAEQDARAAEAEASAPTAGGGRAGFASWGLVGLGVAGVAAGLVLRQWAAAVVGTAAALAGVALLLSGRGSAPIQGSDAARLRAGARAAAEAAAQARSAHEAARREWGAWLAERALDAEGTDPAVVRELLAALAARDDLAARLAEESARADASRAETRAWASRLAAAAPFLPGAAQASPEEAPAFAERAKEMLAVAEALDAERRDLARQAADVRTALEGETARLERVRAEIASIAEAHGVDAADAAARIERMTSEAAEAAGQAKAAHEAVAEEAARLAGKVTAVVDEASMALARQELEGLERKAAALAEKHLVLTVAAGLMREAQRVYERERQPDVLRAAGTHLAVMTGGAYERVVLPLGGGRIVAVTPDGRAKDSDRLSTGAAQQLYLALRIGLIEQLGESGADLPVLMDDVLVNFDPARREGAARAIGGLAAGRQVVFFTCHPDVADTLAAAVPASRRVEL